jgi:hypothetical protein
MHWYVQIQNQAYGPYSESQMQGFVAEGRVNEQSLISNDPAQGFYAALGYDVFRLWAGTGQAVAAGGLVSPYQQPAPVYTPEPAQTYQENYQPIPETVTDVYTPAPADNAATNIFLVMAEIRSDGAMGFLKALQGFGTAQRIGDTVWLLKSPSGVEQLRNTLSQSLDRQDRLFILDSTANKTAWFNIGADLDGRIRELWSEDED